MIDGFARLVSGDPWNKERVTHAMEEALTNLYPAVDREEMGLMKRTPVTCLICYRSRGDNFICFWKSQFVLILKCFQ